MVRVKHFIVYYILVFKDLTVDPVICYLKKQLGDSILLTRTYKLVLTA